MVHLPLIATWIPSMPRYSPLRYKPAMEGLEERLVLSGYSPAQIKTAYGLSAVGFKTSNGSVVAADGTGETIAIVVAFHDPYLVSDLHTFDVRYNLPDPVLNQINLAGNATDDGWAGEETLDVEWAHAIAPGAKLVVVEAASDNTNDLLAAVAVARNTAGVVAVSMSWGGPELANESSYDSTYFTTPAGHTGITFITASGDNGASGGAEWPASSPNVLSVGGTTLTTGSGGKYISETAWSGSGVGVSKYENQPAYQANVQSTGKRTVPDVSFLGDPNTGVDVYTTNPSNGRGSWSTVGGTSLGSPAWAGIIAIVDQGLNLAGSPSMDGATQTIPRLYALANTSAFETVINSAVIVKTATGNFRRSTGTSVTLSSTGIGTPAGGTLIAALTKNSTTITPPAPPPSVAVATAEVQKLYLTILGRAPDPTGLSAAVNAIEAGTPVGQMAAILLTSAEYDSILVQAAYKADLGRAASLAEQANGVSAMLNGLTANGLHLALLGSVEYNTLHVSNTDFVQSVYQDVLKRTASPSEVANAQVAITRGLSRYQLVQFLLNSAEAQINTIDALYLAYLGRQPEATAVDNCLALFQTGKLTANGLAVALASSAEFVASVS